MTKAQRPERGAMLIWNVGVRKGKVSLSNIADEGPVGTQRKISKQLLETQDWSSEERITSTEAIREAMPAAGIAKGRD